jgi:hypothetical protein
MKKKKWTRYLLIVLAIAAVSALVTGYLIWNKPHAEARKIKGEAITAHALVEAYLANERNANVQYLDKVLRVTGKVLDKGYNQDSLPTLSLESGNDLVKVYCTLVKGEQVPDTGRTVTIKGFCVGILSDVTINEAIIDNDHE